MKSIVLAAICLLSTAPVFAATSLGRACKAGIVQDLNRAGYAVESLRLVGQTEGSCDGETCNPDTLKLHVEAKTRSEKNVDLVVLASGTARGEEGCRVVQIKIAR